MNTCQLWELDHRKIFQQDQTLNGYIYACFYNKKIVKYHCYEYYHQLFKLWQQTETFNDKKIDKVKLTLKLSISHAFLAMKTLI